MRRWPGFAILYVHFVRNSEERGSDPRGVRFSSMDGGSDGGEAGQGATSSGLLPVDAMTPLLGDRNAGGDGNGDRAGPVTVARRGPVTVARRRPEMADPVVNT